MHFLYPTYLWGFLLIIIPVVIHLFQLRKYRTIYFSSLKFLKQIEIEQKRKSRLRELLLLITRILIICLLVMAFAHPVLPGQPEKTGENQVVGIYIDNSPSMSNMSGGQSLLDYAKSSALKIAGNYPKDTRYYLLHNDDLFNSRFPLESEDIISNIELLKLSSTSSDLGNILQRFSQINGEFLSKEYKKLYILSDLQRSFLKIESIPDSLAFTARIIELPRGNTNNIFIDSCWFSAPVQNAEKRHTIHARINNNSDLELQSFPVRLLIGDSLVAQESLSLAPYSSNELQFSYNMEKTGWLSGTIEIRDYPVTFDNFFYFSYKISDRIPVLQIYSGQENTHLKALFESDSYYDYVQTEAGNMPFQDLNKFRLIVLNSINELSPKLSSLLFDYVSGGGSLLVLPPADEIKGKLNLFLQTFGAPGLSNMIVRSSQARIPENMVEFYSQVSMNPLQQVEWPVYSKYYRILNEDRQSSALLVNETGRPLLFRKLFQKGYLTISAAPLEAEFTNFQIHPLFVPFLYFLANTGMEDQELFSRIGRIKPVSVDLETSPDKGPVKLMNKAGIYEEIPNQFRDPNSGRIMLYMSGYSGPAGILEAGRDNTGEARLALNYPREESLMDNFRFSELSNLIQEFGWSNISLVEDKTELEPGQKNLDKAKSLSLVRILILLAIIFLLLESVIHRNKS